MRSDVSNMASLVVVIVAILDHHSARKTRTLAIQQSSSLPPRIQHIFNKTALKVLPAVCWHSSHQLFGHFDPTASVHIFTVTDCSCVRLMLNVTLTWRLKHFFTWIQSIEMENSHFHTSL